METREDLFKVKELENDILHIQVKDCFELNVDEVKDMIESIDQFGKDSYHLIVDLGDYSFFDAKAGELFAKLASSMCDAFILSTFTQKIAFKYYMHNCKPNRKTEMFKSIENGIEWITSLQKDSG